MDYLPGPLVEPEGTRFTLWAPKLDSVKLLLVNENIRVPMDRRDRGYFTARTREAGHDTLYRFVTRDGDFPDPASRFQPDGVHGASRVVDFSGIDWSNSDFVPCDPADLVLYELHVGTFTQNGDFQSAAQRLPELAGLGITAVEVMPISEFPGSRNWGYDGVYPYAAQSTYGGPLAFCEFVDKAHCAGIAVILDLVLNHFGPEGNYSGVYGHYTTARYRTPWGDAVNVDGPWSDEVRRYFLGCLEHWIHDCHVDGFRLDAIDEIHDESAIPFLSEVSRAVQRFGDAAGKTPILIAESGSNDRTVVEPIERGGLGMHAVWADDFHHTIHTHLTGERGGYYADFGSLSQTARVVEQGWYNSGNYSPAHQRRYGNDPSGLPTRSFVFCTQNHDQVGNRMLGDRLVTLVGPEADRAARSLLLLSPFVPLLFMGQEYGERSPFLFFVDHGDPDLLRATGEGRAREFAAFVEQGEPPNPASPQTFAESVLGWPDESGRSADWVFTRQLLELRRTYDCFRPARGEASGNQRESTEVQRSATAIGNLFLARYAATRHEGLVIVNLGTQPVTVPSDELPDCQERSLDRAESVLCIGGTASWVTDLSVNGEVNLGAYGVLAAVRPVVRETDAL